VAKDIMENYFFSYDIVKIEEVCSKYKLEKYDTVVFDLLDVDINLLDSINHSNIITFENRTLHNNINKYINGEYFDGSMKKLNNYYQGIDYIQLGLNVLMFETKKEYFETHTIGVTFGGSDPNGLTELVLNFILKNGMDKKYKILVIQGINFGRDIDTEFDKIENVVIIKNCYNIIPCLLRCDFCISSRGKTMYELCYLNIPFVTIPNNDREKVHGDELKYVFNFDIDTIEKQFGEIAHIIDSKSYRNTFYHYNKTIINKLKNSNKNIYEIMK
jgi:spore coat polysaccharide biosynthesis predicted glycosyltransferase SpsG